MIILQLLAVIASVILFFMWMTAMFFITSKAMPTRDLLEYCGDYPAWRWVVGWGVYLGGMLCAVPAGILGIVFVWDKLGIINI